MIYKIGSVADMQSIVFENDTIKQTIYHYASILTTEYGADRNVDTDDGGYILYATMGTTAEEIKAFFDYTQNIVEFVEVQDDVCSALYILSSDYGVVIIMSLTDTPPEILKEIN
ncbi:MAG: hypothetical protein IKT38_07570 [Clostridia bacterium]|nr:hypothetical protein [Clostridia bacterium]